MAIGRIVVSFIWGDPKTIDRALEAVADIELDIDDCVRETIMGLPNSPYPLMMGLHREAENYLYRINFHTYF